MIASPQVERIFCLDHAQASGAPQGERQLSLDAEIEELERQWHSNEATKFRADVKRVQLEKREVGKERLAV